MSQRKECQFRTLLIFLTIRKSTDLITTLRRNTRNTRNDIIRIKMSDKIKNAIRLINSMNRDIAMQISIKSLIQISKLHLIKCWGRSLSHMISTSNSENMIKDLIRALLMFKNRDLNWDIIVFKTTINIMWEATLTEICSSISNRQFCQS